MKARFARVSFDVDSTLAAIEGIDELARMRGADISALTERAMRGELPLEAVFATRLALVRPDASMLARVGRLYVKRLLPEAVSTLRALENAGTEVFLVSGALRPALLPLARELGVPGARLFAVDLLLDARGRFAGFDELSPLARADGKRDVLASLRPPRGKIAHVGDGATDLATLPAVDAFFAFTGVATRPIVAAGATAVARSMRQLRALLGLTGSR